VNEHAFGAPEFLQELFARKPPELYVWLWYRPDLRSAWFRDVDEAAGFVLARPELEIYVSNALAATDPGPHGGRGQSDRLTGIIGLCADFDFGPGRVQGKFYKQASAAIVAQLETRPLPPTLVLDTGKGVSAWWLFDDFYSCARQSRRQRVKDIAMGWRRVLDRRAAATRWYMEVRCGWVGTTRVVGSQNHWLVPPWTVKLLNGNGPRYAGPSVFTAHLDSVDTPADVAL
jgi:hypothetical protein